MFETSKHVPKTEKRCCVFKVNKNKITNCPPHAMWHIGPQKNKKNHLYVPSAVFIA